MKVGIIHDDIHELIMIVKELLESKGATVELINCESIEFCIDDGSNDLLNKLVLNDVLFLDRLGEQSNNYYDHLRILKCLEAHGLRIVNNTTAYKIARDKALNYLYLNLFGEKIPKTCVTHNLNSAYKFAETTHRFLSKPALGHSGQGIIKFDSKNDNKSKLRFLLESQKILILQEFIPPKLNRDIRMDIVNGEITDCYYRESISIDEEMPLCNINLGCKAVDFQPTDNLKKLAVRLTNRFNLEIAGVDLLETECGEVYVIEVNPEPDFTHGHYRLPEMITNYLIHCVRG